MKKVRFLILSAWALTILAAYSVAAAANTPAPIGTITLPWQSSLNSPADLLNRIANWLLVIMIPLSVLGIVYSGILYITGTQGGSGEKKVAMAKKNLTWSITGIVVTLLSYLIIREVINIVR